MSSGQNRSQDSRFNNPDGHLRFQNTSNQRNPQIQCPRCQGDHILSQCPHRGSSGPQARREQNTFMVDRVDRTEVRQSSFLLENLVEVATGDPLSGHDHPHFPVRIEGYDVNCLLDSGSTATLLTIDLLKQLKIDSN